MTEREAWESFLGIVVKAGGTVNYGDFKKYMRMTMQERLDSACVFGYDPVQVAYDQLSFAYLNPGSLLLINKEELTWEKLTRIMTGAGPGMAWAAFLRKQHEEEKE